MLLVSQACQLLMLFFRAADLCRSFCRNRVYSQSGLKFADAGALAFFCVEIQAEDSFFTLADSVAAVRRKAHDRVGMLRIETVQIVAGDLLAGTEDRTEYIFSLDAGILQGFQAVESDDGSALIVGDAAAVGHAVLNHHLKRVRIPAISGGNDIHMGEYVHILGSCSVIDGTGIIVRVLRLKSHVLCHGKNAFQRLGRGFTEGFTGKRVCADGRNRDQLCQIA